MPLFTQCCSANVSVVICGSSVKKPSKLGDALDNMQSKLWLYSPVFLVRKECDLWARILDQWMLPLGCFGRLSPALKWGWNRKQNFSTAASTFRSSFQLKSKQNLFQFLREMPDLSCLCRGKASLVVQQLKSFSNFMVCQTPNLIGLGLKKIDTKELLEI